MRDSVLALDTEVEGGRVSQHLSIVLFIFSQSCDGGGGGVFMLRSLSPPSRR